MSVHLASRHPILGNGALLLVCALGTGLVSVGLGKDKSWDLMNYHYYLPYAFIHGRMGWDVAPAQLQTYFNPLADLPFYGLVTTVQQPRLVAFVLGAVHGVAVYFLVKIGWLMLQREERRVRLVLLTAAVAVGTTGAAALPLVGNTSNDWMVAIFVLGGLLALLRATVDDTAGPGFWGYAIVAGLAMGVAMGLKPVAAPFALGGVLAGIVSRPRPIRGLMLASVLGGSTVAGVLAAGGYWMWHLCTMFGNPVFPLYNGIFRSEFWEPVNFSVGVFRPRDPAQWLFYPFYWVRTTAMLVTEPRMRDGRFAVIVVLCVLHLGVRLRAPAAVRPREPAGRDRRTLLVFFITSYVAWLVLFGVYRYLVPLDLLTGLLVVVLLGALLPATAPRALIVSVVSVILMATTAHPNWGRGSFGARYFDVDAPRLPPDAVVLMVGGEPKSYVIPSMRPDARFVSIENNFLRLRQENRLARAIGETVRAHRGPLFVMNVGRDEDRVQAALSEYGLARVADGCRAIRSSFDRPEYGSLDLCPLRRVE